MAITITSSQIGFVPKGIVLQSVSSQPVTGTWALFSEILGQLNANNSAQAPITYQTSGLTTNTASLNMNGSAGIGSNLTAYFPGDMYYVQANQAVTALASVTATPVQTIEIKFFR